MILPSCIGEDVLIFEVVFIAHEDYGEFIISVIACFLQPLVEVVEGDAIGGVVHEYGCDGASVI